MANVVTIHMDETLSKKRMLCRRRGAEAATCGSGGGGRGTRPQGMEKLIEGGYQGVGCH